MDGKMPDNPVHSLLAGNAPILMGIVNITPDSFSDGGHFIDADKAIAHGRRLMDEGAHILDIGGESTRPGAAIVTPEEEQSRILPVITALARDGAVISVDTRNASTMAAALDAGAAVINDVSALEHDPDALAVVAKSGATVCLMHMKGAPGTMQDAPVYRDVFAEVYAYLEGRIAACIDAGVDRKCIVIDPGIGFGKTLEHNLILLSLLKDFASLRSPVLLGASRKRFIEALCPDTPADKRLPGSLAAVLAGYNQGVKIFRVHDVAETAQALAVYKHILT